MPTYCGYIKKTSYKRVKDLGGEPLYLRIICGRKNQYYPLGWRVPAKDWNFKKRVVRESHPDHRLINALIKKEMARAQRIELELRLKDIPITAQRMKLALSGAGRSDDYREFLSSLIDQYKLSGQDDMRQKYQRLYNILSAFRPGLLSFDDLDIDFVEAFDRYLIMKGLRINGIGKVHDYLKASFNKAVKKGKTSVQNPYERFVIRREFIEPEYLTMDDFRKVEKVQLVGNLALARDFFLLACYMSGMRANELLKAKRDDIEIREEIHLLRQHVSKRGIEKRRVKYSIIIPQALEIINRYKSKTLLPLKESTKDSLLNKWLGKVAELAGVKKFTTKYARKTLINRLSSLKYPSSQIANLVGHSSSQTTERSYVGIDLNFQSRALEEAFK